ncbi:hypothetical protein MNL09_03630 [Bartonella krasnovii]|nr:hypothetical protein MNL09_03630 [Bartonella krasnovii]
MGFIALIISCYAAYNAFKTIKALGQEIDEKDKTIDEQNNLIKRLSNPNISYCANCSKIVCREIV